MNEASAPSTRRPSSIDSNENVEPVLSLGEKRPDPEQPADTNEVHFEYLNFDTELPAVFTSPDPSLPPPPDLSKYTSPFEWSAKRKALAVYLCTAATFHAAYSAGTYSIASEPLRAKWGLSSVAFNTGVTTWCVGFASSPMVLAPFSEINGRRPVFLASGAIFMAALIGCALTDHFAGMLVARFFVGVGASTYATMCGGVMSDIFHAEHRNTPMAIYAGGALAGTGFGPMVAGFVVVHASSWRWVFYHQIIALGITLAMMYFLFAEPRGSVLLSRRAAIVNKYLDSLPSTTTTIPQTRYKTLADSSRSSLSHMIYLSLTTPFKLLATEPVVFFFSLWAAFAWAILYMTFSVIPLAFSTTYNFSTQSNALVFTSIGAGSILGCLLSIYQEKLARRYWPKFTARPEGRLYFACLESALLPIGLFWFGWTATPEIHYISPIIALGVAQVGIFSIYLAVFNYLADVYHRYASSALAGQSFCRNMLAAVFPLFTAQMFTRLGYGGAGSLLGGIAVVLTGVPWVLVFKGEAIRARSRIAREIMGKEGGG
jgi:MFS family permease